MIAAALAILAAVGPVIVPLVGMLLEQFGAAARRRKEIEHEADQDIRAGIAARDRGRITAGFDALNRV